MTRNALHRGALVLGIVFGLAALRDAHALSTGAAAPDFALPTLDGKTVKLSSLRGKVVLVDFWASWCAPCRQELPLLQKLSDKLAQKGIVILVVNINKKKEDAAKFAADNKLTMRIPLDTKNEVVAKYEPPKMPSSYLVDKQGIVRKVNAGFFGADDMKKLEADLVALMAK